MVDPVSILIGVLEFLLNVVVGIVLDVLIDVLWDLLRAVLDAVLDLVDPITLLVIALLVLGVIGTLVPFVPGPLLSLAGVGLYWINSGFSDPGIGWVVVFTGLALAAIFIDYFGGVVSARIGGASTGTTVVAAIVGIVLLLVGLGPIGFVIGVAGTVFGLEYYRHSDAERAVKSAAVTFGGMLGSAVAQVVVTGAILVLMIAFIVL